MYDTVVGEFIPVRMLPKSPNCCLQIKVLDFGRQDLLWSMGDVGINSYLTHKSTSLYARNLKLFARKLFKMNDVSIK